jgi:hypothetical protein
MQRLPGPVFGQNSANGGLSRPGESDFERKMAREGADGQAALEIRRFGGFERRA